MKNKLRAVSALLCAALTCLSVPAGGGLLTEPPVRVSAADDQDLILHYSSEAGTNFSGNAWDNDEAFYKALPLGNGRIGAMVYCNCPTERFDLNEATFWSGGPGNNNKKVSAETMERCWQQMQAGNYRDADGTIGASMIGGGEAKYQSVGTLNLDLGHKGVTGYDRFLDMNTAVAGCTYQYQGSTYRRESFVSHPDQVLVTRISADKAGGVSLTASYDCSLTGQYTVEADGSDTLVMNGHGDSEYGMPYAVWFSTRTKVMPEGGSVSVSGNRISVTGADAVVILTAVRTNFIDYATCNGDEKGDCAADLNAAARKSYSDLYAAHLDDYQALFGRGPHRSRGRARDHGGRRRRPDAHRHG